MKYCITLIIVTFLCGTTQAQLERTPTPSAKNSAGNNDILSVLKSLNLTEKQATQLKIIRDNMLDSVDVINSNTTLSTQQKRRNILQTRLAQKKAIDAILTPEQQLIFNKSVQQKLNTAAKTTNNTN